MTKHHEHRYNPYRPPGHRPDHPHCLILRCNRRLRPNNFHLPLIQRGQPRRYCSPACRTAEHRRLNM